MLRCAIAGAVAALAIAGDTLPVARQNALVQKYCAVCHSDSAANGGLSLEHFDAAQVAPSLAAMLLSKLTSGVLLKTVQAATSDPTAAALVADKVKGGAINAAGLPVPDNATLHALVNALAVEARGANEWHVNHASDPATKAPRLTASILRELPSARNPGQAGMYRLVVECDAATHEGTMQLSWAPAPTTGTLWAAVDGKPPVEYKVEGLEKMGNGSRGTTGPAAIGLHLSTLPGRVLRISNLFPNESVEFPFGELPEGARRSLAACY